MGASVQWLAVRQRPAAVLTEAYLRQEYVTRHRSASAIAVSASVTHTTVLKYLRLFAIPTRVGERARRHAEVDATPFRDLASDWHAYWVGFLAADGGVSRGALVRLKLADRDAAHVAAFAQGLGTTHPVRTIPHLDHTAVYVEVFSKPLAAALGHWGIVDNKTLVMEFPRHLPAARLGAYLRGYFDGDGSVSVRHRQAPNTQWVELNCKFTSGSLDFITGLADVLQTHAIDTGTLYKQPNRHAYELRVLAGKDNVRRFVHLLYDGATIALERKRLCFAAFLDL